MGAQTEEKVSGETCGPRAGRVKQQQGVKEEESKRFSVCVFRLSAPGQPTPVHRRTGRERERERERRVDTKTGPAELRSGFFLFFFFFFNVPCAFCLHVCSAAPDLVHNGVVYARDALNVAPVYSDPMFGAFVVSGMSRRPALFPARRLLFMVGVKCDGDPLFLLSSTCSGQERHTSVCTALISTWSEG